MIGLLTELVLVRVAALHVILEKGGIEEGFLTVWTLTERNKKLVNISSSAFLTKEPKK